MPTANEILKKLKTTFLNSGVDLELPEGKSAPLFRLQTHTGESFDLESRRGQWTVLYFYPKADTPGCTKQACAFRDNIQKIRELGADVFGISVDAVADQAKFHEKFHLNFTLLADADAAVTKLYGAKMPAVKIAKRWTFVIDPGLKIRALEKNVDPIHDADRMRELILDLQLKDREGAVSA